MTAASRRVCRAAALVLALVAAPAFAHKASDAYLQLQVAPEAASLRVDVALRDLDVALDLDSDGDGRLNWREVRSAWPAIETYLRANVAVQGCALPRSSWALERRVDGVYAALTMQGECSEVDGVGAASHSIRYTVLREVDPTHRGLAKVMVAGGAPVLRVLDPGKRAAFDESATETKQGGNGVAAMDERMSASAPPQMPSTPLTLPSTPPTSAQPSPPNESPTAVAGFLREGIHHIVTGYDHVLFLLCLMLPAVMRRTPRGWEPVEGLGQALMPVLGIVTAFTLAHSITLGLAAMKWVSLSPRFIEPAIAVTIVLAAIDNLRPIFRGRRALVTFAFGLVHGFGFAGVLSELDLPAADFAWALLQFNLGIELGQLTIVAIAVALLFGLRSRRRYPAWVIGGGSLAAIMVGVLWFIERTANVSLLPL
jgi:hypothetical protein